MLPGFVDAHTHPIFAGERAEEFSCPRLGPVVPGSGRHAAHAGISMSTVRAMRQATEDELLALAEMRARSFLRHGTTTIEAKTGYGLSPDGEPCKLRKCAGSPAR